MKINFLFFVLYPRCVVHVLTVFLVFFPLDTTRPHIAIATKAVYGLCVDPHDEHRIASFSEVS